MIKSIELTNYRIFDSLKINTNNHLIIISGNNAVGKTSILEAIYYVSTSKSHRTNSIESLIKKNCDFAKINITATKKYKSIISKEGKTNYLNNVDVKKISNYIGDLKVVMFSPLDINLINGSKSERRGFLDLQLSLVDKKYLSTLSMYKHILNERNTFLKECTNPEDPLLSVYTKELANQAKIIYERRFFLIEKLNEFLNEATKELKMPEKVFLRYESTVDGANPEKSFQAKIKYDLFTKITNVGPHRDDFTFLIDDLEAKEYASQGQLRGITIALKFALTKFIYFCTKEEPILLLDDVFNELDNNRQFNLLDYLDKGLQTFITTTSVINIPDQILNKGLVINIDDKKETEFD